MKIRSFFILLTVALLADGCATQTQDAENPPKHAKRVQIAMYDSTKRPESKNLDIYDIKPPTRPFKVVALLTCEGAAKEEAAMTEAIFYRAKMVGADGVLIVDTQSGQEGVGVWGSSAGGFRSSTRCVFRAKAIVYLDQ